MQKRYTKPLKENPIKPLRTISLGLESLYLLARDVYNSSTSRDEIATRAEQFLEFIIYYYIFRF